MLLRKKRKSEEEKDTKDLVKAALTKGERLSDEDLEQVFGGRWGLVNEFDFSFFFRLFRRF